jgi:DNA mismatch repair protein MutL
MDIKKLPDDLINMIKAGEVVERPLNVVKELVENSLDAKATKVSIELIDGGKALISIKDNGKGIPSKELPLALERHTTSKLRTFDDLMSLLSYGFRGEALASIISVSDFEISSRHETEEMGRFLRMEDQKIVEDKRIPFPIGTQITVKDIFKKIPVRLKFLKGTSTEYHHIHEFLVAMALARPSVGVEFIHNGKKVFSYKENQSKQQRFETIFELEAKHFIPVFYERGPFKIEGYVELPEHARSLPKQFLTFINGRLVKDKIIKQGIMEGYSSLLMKGLFPSAVLALEINPQWCDVNVHPTKMEVRFTDPLLIQDQIAIALQGALKNALQKKHSLVSQKDFVSQKEDHLSESRGSVLEKNKGSMSDLRPVSGSMSLLKPGLKREDSSFYAFARPSSPTPSLSSLSSSRASLSEGKNPSYGNSFEERGEGFQAKGQDFQKWGGSKNNYDAPLDVSSSRLSNTSSYKSLSPEEEFEGEVNSKTSLFEVKDTGNSFVQARYLGQYLKCYLLFEFKEELWVVDQHAFHERILYEDLMKQFKDSQISVQNLLSPYVLSYPSYVIGKIEEYKEAINRIGFIFEVLDHHEIAIDGFPSFLKPAQIGELFDSLVVRLLCLTDERFEETHPIYKKAAALKKDLPTSQETSLEGEHIFRLFFATVACHSAIRAGEDLNDELVRRLLKRAEDVDFYIHCPHGRPVVRRFSSKDVGSWFLRT